MVYYKIINILNIHTHNKTRHNEPQNFSNWVRSKKERDKERKRERMTILHNSTKTDK